jgi:hypothetical protein
MTGPLLVTGRCGASARDRCACRCWFSRATRARAPPCCRTHGGEALPAARHRTIAGGVHDAPQRLSPGAEPSSSRRRGGARGSALGGSPPCARRVLRRSRQSGRDERPPRRARRSSLPLRGRATSGGSGARRPATRDWGRPCRCRDFVPYRATHAWSTKELGRRTYRGL